MSSPLEKWALKVQEWRFSRKSDGIDRPSIATLMCMWDDNDRARHARRMLYKREVMYRYRKGIPAPVGGR